jgi:hypothetical protein
MSFHVLFLSNEKTEHSSQVFIGKANFSRVMKKLENAGDLSGRQNVRVLCRPISIQGYSRLHMRPFFAILGLLLCFMPAQADELPVIKDSEAVQYVGKNVEVRGLVVSVTTSPLGTAFINFGREYPDQTFAGFIAAGSKMGADQRIAMLQGKIIGITGIIELYQGKPEIEVTSTDQIKGLDSQRAQ